MSKKWVLLFLLTVLLLPFSFQLILQSGFISEKAKRYSEASIERFLGQQVQIDQVRLRLFSASATFKDIALNPKNAGAPPPILAKEIRIYFNPWSLLTQAFIIRRIVIDRPVFSLTPEALAEKPFSLTPKSGGAGKNSPNENEKQGPPPVIVRLIQIQDGAVAYHGGGALKAITLKHIDAEIEPDLLMRRFEIHLSGEEGLFSTEKEERKIDRLEGRLVVLPDRIDIKKATGVSNQISLATEGTLRFGQGDLDLQIDLHLPLQEIGIASIASKSGGRGKLPASDKRLSADATIQGRLVGPYFNPAFTGRISLPHLFADGSEIGSLISEISYQDRKARLTSLSGALFSGTFSGDGEGTFSGEKPSYRLALQYQRFSLEEMESILYGLKKKGESALQGIFLEGALSLSGNGFEKEGVTAEGRMTLKRRPLFSALIPAEAGSADRLIALFQEGNLSWSWSGGRLTIDQGTARLPQTEATFRGGWDVAEGFSMEAALNSDEVRKVAESLHVPIQGALHLDGTLSGKADDPLFKGQVTLLKWALKGQAFGAFAAQFTYQDRQLTLKKGSLQAPFGLGGNRQAPHRRKGTPPPYRFEGTLRFDDPEAPAFEFNAEAASADPQEFLTLFKQSIPFQTRATGPLLIKGTPQTFSVQGPLTLEKGVLYGESFDRGRLDLTVTQKEVALKKVVLEKRDRRVEGEGAIQYQGTFQIALKTPHLRLQESHYFQSHVPSLDADAAVELSGRGSLQRPQLKLIASAQNLRFGEVETGAGIVKIDWNGKEVRYEGDFPKKALSFKGRLQLTESYPFAFQGRFKRLRVDPFFRDRLTGPLSRMVLLLSGAVEGEGKISEIEKGRFAASLTEFSADFGGYPLQNDGPIVFHSDHGVFQFETARFKGENTELEFNGGLTIFKAWDLLAKGRADLNLIKFFTKEIADGKGTATLDLRVLDQWENPRIRGELALQDGVIRTESLSQSIHISSLSAIFSERRLVLETFEGEMGRGKFHASGKADRVGFGVGEFSLLLELTDVRVHLFEDLSANVDGEILFKGDGKTQALQGELVLKRASYEKKVDLKSLVLELQKKREETFPSEIPLIGATEMNVHLYGKENLWIINNVAKIPLEVDVFLKGSLDHPLLIGRIDIPRGSVYFRKNEFKVLSGSVEFLNSEAIDPTFDIKAKTQVRGQKRTYAIDLGLIGRLSQFTLTLTATPALPETDILALLTVGKTTEEIAQNGKGGGSVEVTSFVVSELLEEPVQKSGVVDRIQVDPYVNGPKSSSGTRLTAEKRLLEDRLLVTYSITLDPAEEQRIRMIYELSKNVSLVGERDENGRIGGDIRFRFEFR